MPEIKLVAVDRADVTPFYEALAAALDGSGPAVAPYEAGTEAPQLPDQATIDAEAPETLALVVSTSGSTGTPKRAMLTREALTASATATYDRLGGAGTWLLPLPPQHIAGAQVLVRSIIDGTTPIVMDSWSVKQFTKAAQLVARNAPPFSPIYTSLVPTQLQDVLLDEAGTVAARKFRAILVGGAATSDRLLTQAREAGLKIVTTYGSSETAGGCVYDGVPLDGVGVHIVPDEQAGDLPDTDSRSADADAGAGTSGRVALTGPTLASGYLGAPDESAAAFVTLADGQRAFLTDDLGSFTDRLTLHGRVDAAINTGGYKVAPYVVEEVARRVPGVIDAVVVPVADERFGDGVGVAVIKDQLATEIEVTSAIRAACRDELPHYAVPRHFAFFNAFPLIGVGKPNRAAIVASGEWHNLA